MNDLFTADSNRDIKYLRQILLETNLIKASAINAKQKFILELYLEGTDLALIIAKTKLNESEINREIKKSIDLATKQITELLSKERFLVHKVVDKGQTLFNGEYLSEDFYLSEVYFSPRAIKAFETLEIYTSKDLKGLTKERLMSLPKIGTKTITEIVDKAIEFGIIIKE